MSFKKNIEEAGEYEKQYNVVNRDLDLVSGVIGTSNIFKVFAMIKNVITSIITASIKEKNKNKYVWLIIHSYYVNKAHHLGPLPHLAPKPWELLNQALCECLHSKGVTPVTVAAENYDYTLKQKKGKGKYMEMHWNFVTILCNKLISKFVITVLKLKTSLSNYFIPLKI